MLIIVMIKTADLMRRSPVLFVQSLVINDLHPPVCGHNFWNKTYFTNVIIFFHIQIFHLKKKNTVLSEMHKISLP